MSIGEMSIGETIMGIAGASCGGALAAVALANPVGAAGGAIYGASDAVANIIANALITHSSTDSPMLTVAKAVTLFSISIFGGWKLAAAFGVNMSLESALILSFASFGFVVGIAAAAATVHLAARGVKAIFS